LLRRSPTRSSPPRCRLPAARRAAAGPVGRTFAPGGRRQRNYPRPHLTIFTFPCSIKRWVRKPTSCSLPFLLCASRVIILRSSRPA
jgi:hypothetical protein